MSYLTTFKLSRHSDEDLLATNNLDSYFMGSGRAKSANEIYASRISSLPMNRRSPASSGGSYIPFMKLPNFMEKLQGLSD